MSADAKGSFDGLTLLLRALKLPTVARCSEEIARKAEREGWSFGQYLHHLAELEVQERKLRRIDRLQRASGLPAEKTLATLDKNLLPSKVQKLLPMLCDGDFVDRGDNVLAFGLPGRGKTHLVCAIGHELIKRSRRVWFTPTFSLVQMLLAAKRDLRLEKELAALDVFDVVILDDIGYVQQNRDEMEVLFTFLAQRYERRSVIITSNLLFREWDSDFQRSDDHCRRDRQTRASRRHHRDERAEYPRNRSQETRDTNDNYANDNYDQGNFRETERWGSVIVVDGEM